MISQDRKHGLTSIQFADRNGNMTCMAVVPLHLDSATPAALSWLPSEIHLLPLASYLDQRIALPARFRHGYCNVVGRNALAGVAFIDAVMGVAVEDRAHLVEPVDALG